ncbi:MAG: pyrrolo-quinoline quinone, partial [Roseiflexus sp.]|nr:pyrrolo-quinoline quinone [Roseiflexus sp.]
MRSSRFGWLQIVAILTVIGILLSLASTMQLTPARGEHLVQPSSAPRVQATWQMRRPESTTAVSVSAPTNAASLYLPLVLSGQSVSGPLEEWSQHAHNAQRTGYTSQTVPYPWRWRWSWNGPNASGGIAKVTTGGSLPRNVQPVTGGGRVYIAAGVDGVFALSEATGQQLWQRSGIGAIRSTVAYD